jgi:hypothetical protein
METSKPSKKPITQKNWRVYVPIKSAMTGTSCFTVTSTCNGGGVQKSVIVAVQAHLEISNNQKMYEIHGVATV